MQLERLRKAEISQAADLAARSFLNYAYFTFFVSNEKRRFRFLNTILFDCSYCDDTLQQYQAYIRTGIMTSDTENGDLFQKDLTEMVKGLQENIPGIGIYIWNHAEDTKTHNTQHTIISSNVFDKLEDGISVADWIFAAINGDMQSHGLALLER